MHRNLFFKLFFSLLFSFHCILIFSQGFTVSEGKLLDANGKEFIIHVWYIKESYKTLDRLAEVNVNCVRIVWKTLTWWGKEIFESENGISKTSKKASVFIRD